MIASQLSIHVLLSFNNFGTNVVSSVKACATNKRGNDLKFKVCFIETHFLIQNDRGVFFLLIFTYQTVEQRSIDSLQVAKRENLC